MKDKKKQKAKKATTEETLELLQVLFMSRQSVITRLRRRVERIEYIIKRMCSVGNLIYELPLELDEKKPAKPKRRR